MESWVSGLVTVATICLLTLSIESSLNPMNGKHLRIIWPRWSGNPKGLSGPLKGGVIIDYISARFNFSYDMVRVIENQIDPSTNRKGQLTYLMNNESDLLVNAILPTSQRLKLVDLTLPWSSDVYAFLIPASGATANLDAVIKPFQWPVWLALGIAIIIVILIFNIFHHLVYGNRQGNNSSADKNASQYGEQYYLYVFGNLISQGGTIKSKKLSFRWVAGCWTLAAFVFVQAYTSTLFTYIILPNTSPLINSIYDIATSPDINLLVKKGGTIDSFFLNINQSSGVYGKLRNRIDSFPGSRCNLVSECISLITKGSRNAFADGKPYQLDAIKNNYDKTKKCDLQLAKEGFLSYIASLALPKNSIYTNTVNQGLLELREIGLIDFWDLWFRPMPSKCMDNYGNVGLKTRRQGDTHPPLSFNNLIGAFVVLTGGLICSFLVFCYEYLVFHFV